MKKLVPTLAILLLGAFGAACGTSSPDTIPALADISIVYDDEDGENFDQQGSVPEINTGENAFGESFSTDSTDSDNSAIAENTQVFDTAKVSFRLITKNITTGTSWIDFELINESDAELSYGENFLLYETGDENRLVEPLPGRDRHTLQLILMPHSSNFGSFDIGYFYGELEPGTYRIEKALSMENSQGGEFVSAVEFEVFEVDK
ncbi:MAG: hypothetical protein FWH20_04755 [Oscillospiraceae bacterium]|nr:hypothetical protein [Oscillospiraceae bacterium]